MFTGMMAVLTTSRAVLKDAATRKQVHIIQEHLVALSKDFTRFQTRMDKLATHIGQANKDVGDVQVSAKKITSRFTKIEKVEAVLQPSSRRSRPGPSRQQNPQESKIRESPDPESHNPMSVLPRVHRTPRKRPS